MTWAAEGRLWSEWEQQAALMALLANCNRDPKKRRKPWLAWDFFHRPGVRRPTSGGNALAQLYAVREAIAKRGA